MRYALNLDKEYRILSATYEEYATEEMPIVDYLPEGDITDYRYIKEEYVYDPVPVPEPEPTWEEKTEAQVLYTAIMTDTLIEEDEETVEE